MGWLGFGVLFAVASGVAWALSAKSSRRPTPQAHRQALIRSSYVLQAQLATQPEDDLVRRLAQAPGLATPNTAAFEARTDLLRLVENRGYQKALARWVEWRPHFAPHVTTESLEAVEAVLSQLAERLAIEDFARETREQLIERARAHPYFASFTRRSPPGVRRFFELLNKGENTQLLVEWPDVVAAWWEDEGAPEPRRSLAVAPELRGLVVALSRKPRPAA
jgi:hypothetical protein